MQPLLKLLLILLLGGWLGASVFFSFVAAPALFQLARSEVLTRDQAGDVAEALLKRYALWSIIILALALVSSGLLALGTAQPRFIRCSIIVTAALIIALFSTLVWTPRVHNARMERRAHPSPQLDKTFGRLHAISFGLNLLTIGATAAAFVVVVRME